MSPGTSPVGLCSLYCTFAKYTSVTVANSWSGNIKYTGFFFFSPSSEPVVS